MKKLIKKHFVAKKIVTLALCAVTFLSIGSVNTYATPNYKDKDFDFTFANKQAYTKLREKRDDSSSYMKCKTITNGTSYTAHVVGKKTKNDAKYIDVSKGHTYKFVKGTTYKMLNWAHEWGYSYSAIAANPNYGYSFTATGLWSPDSI